jgi:acetyltransferase-like isoleucine patch superfamily enzyme
MMRIGKGAVILSGFKVRNPQRITIGERFYCNYNFFVQGSGGVQIGNDVIVGPNVSIFSENHQFARRDVPINRQGTRCAPVSIGDDVWIGAGATILPGVTIGNGCVVAAGSVVTRSFEEFSVVGGVPARVISSR